MVEFAVDAMYSAPRILINNPKVIILVFCIIGRSIETVGSEAKPTSEAIGPPFGLLSFLT